MPVFGCMPRPHRPVQLHLLACHRKLCKGRGVLLLSIGFKHTCVPFKRGKAHAHAFKQGYGAVQNGGALSARPPLKWAVLLMPPPPPKKRVSEGIDR